MTHECDFPPEANDKPRVTISYIDSSVSSAEIRHSSNRMPLASSGGVHCADGSAHFSRPGPEAGGRDGDPHRARCDRDLRLPRPHLRPRLVDLEHD
ncbi:MAG: hypothetical protein ABI559_01875 [Chloroflexota bacterium]